MGERIITFSLVFLVFLASAIYVVVNQGTFLSAAVIAGLVGLALLLKPQILLMGAIVTGVMELKMPAFAGVFKLQHFFFFGLFAWGVLNAALKKGLRPPISSRFLIGFAAVLGLIVAVRGIGFRVFGSEAFGGADYVKLFLAIGAYWGGLQIPLKPRQLRAALILFSLGALLPMAAQIVVMRNPSLFLWLQRFIEVRAQYILSEEELYGWRGVTGGTGGRLHAAAMLATGLWFAGWCLWGLRGDGKRRMLFALLPVAGMLAMLSGFRGSTVGILMLGGLVLFVTSRRKTAFVMAAMGLSIGLYVLLLVAGPKLPTNAQRALSFVPGPAWDVGAKSDATHSITFRLNIWQYALPYIPKYLLIGRGILLENVYRQHAWRDWSYYASPEFFYATHSYHSGPLSLLLDTGLPGLILFLGFQIALVREAWKWWRNSRVRAGDPFLKAALIYFCVRITYQLVVYYLLYGDLKYNLMDWVVIGLLIHSTGKALLGVPAPQPSVEPGAVSFAVMPARQGRNSRGIIGPLGETVPTRAS